MEDRARARLAWMISILLHGLAFLLAIPSSPRTGGQGFRLLEVGLIELAEEGPPPGAPVIPALETVRMPARPPEHAGKIPAEGAAKAGATETGTPAGAPTPHPAPPSSPSPGGGGEPGAASGPESGFGTGEGLVRSHPLYYPKGAQNEGVEGRVRLAVIVKPDGRAQAELLAPSGDERLDLYSLRAVGEFWRYEQPPVPVRLQVELIFAGGGVDVEFLGSEVLPEGDAF